MTGAQTACVFPEMDSVQAFTVSLLPKAMAIAHSHLLPQHKHVAQYNFDTGTLEFSVLHVILTPIAVKNRSCISKM